MPIMYHVVHWVLYIFYYIQASPYEYEVGTILPVFIYQETRKQDTQIA